MPFAPWQMIWVRIRTEAKTELLKERRGTRKWMARALEKACREIHELGLRHKRMEHACYQKTNRVVELEGILEGIRDYEPVEVCKDEFAYDRMVDAFRDAAKQGVGEREEGASS